jgi:acetyl esterase/lipase
MDPMDRRSFLLSAAALASCTLISPATARARIETRSYGPGKLDIHAPATGRPAPVIVYLHGGGWRRGNRRYVQEKPAYFNGLGLVFVSVDYRMLPEADVATQRDDVSAAMDWVRANIAQFGGDPKRIILMGHSAGAHLAALAALSTSRSKVIGMISNDTAVYDLGLYAKLRGGRLPRIHDQAFPDPGKWDSLSPASYVGQGTPPPALILWSRVRHHEATARSFAKLLRAAGGKAELFDGPDLTHMEINKLIGTPKGQSINTALETFLKSVGAIAV